MVIEETNILKKDYRGSDKSRCSANLSAPIRGGLRFMKEWAFPWSTCFALWGFDWSWRRQRPDEEMTVSGERKSGCRREKYPLYYWGFNLSLIQLKNRKAGNGIFKSKKELQNRSSPPTVGAVLLARKLKSILGLCRLLPNWLISIESPKFSVDRSSHPSWEFFDWNFVFGHTSRH